MGEPGIPGGVGVGCGGCVAGLAILAGWVKVRYQPDQVKQLCAT